MNIDQALKLLPYEPQHRLKMNYSQLKNCGIDTGFTSVFKDGRDYHMITRDIVVSFMRFNDQHLTTLMFANGKPIHLDFDDEIKEYYSDYIEIRYIFEGFCEVDFAGEKVSFTAGDICLISSTACHKESIPNSNCLLLNISIKREYLTESFLNSVTISPLQEFLRKNILRYSDEQNYLKFTPQTPEQSETIQEYCYNIVNEIVNHISGYMEISSGYIIRLMDFLSQGYHYNFTKQENEQFSLRLFETITAYMKENIQTITLQDLADEFHYHPNYFGKLIRRHTGMSYSEYLIDLRIQAAKQYLTGSNITIEEIMWIVGYNNKGFFYRKFRELAGMNPLEYRKTTARN